MSEACGIYKHSLECIKERKINGDRCVCFGRRARNAGLLAVSFAATQYYLGVLIESAAIRGDAGHLALDSVSDGAAYLIAIGALRSVNFSHTWNEWGGRVQSVLLACAGIFILWEMLFHGHGEKIDGLYMFSLGSVATAIAYWRFKILHPKGGMINLFRDITLSLRHGRQEFSTFVGEIFHVMTDIGLSAFAAIGGLLVYYQGGSPLFDSVAAIAMATLAFVGSPVAYIFAERGHAH